MRAHLQPYWPPMHDVETLVRKPSGQFIYASVVIKFLFSASANPSIRLDIIRGLRPTGRLTPFAQLDALYQHILSQVDNLPPTLEFLAYLIFGDARSILKTSHFFQIEYTEVESIFAPLTSVILFDGDNGVITFHHASLPDFLRDKRRNRVH